MIERQTIVTWHTPDEKVPPEGQIVVATISGHRPHVHYDHALALAEWYDDGEGWELTGIETMDDLTVHAWCDLEPYGGGNIERKERDH